MEMILVPVFRTFGTRLGHPSARIGNAVKLSMLRLV